MVEKYVAQATRPPAQLTPAEAQACIGNVCFETAWRLWDIGERDRAREYLARSAKLTAANPSQKLMRRLAAWSPATYRSLSRLHG